jgi:hypothetical protein
MPSKPTSSSCLPVNLSHHQAALFIFNAAPRRSFAALPGDRVVIFPCHGGAAGRSPLKRLQRIVGARKAALSPTLSLTASPLKIPAYWTPEQAFAVVELLDDLRDRIWAHYSAQLLDQYREQYGPADSHHTDDATDKPSL